MKRKYSIHVSFFMMICMFQSIYTLNNNQKPKNTIDPRVESFIKSQLKRSGFQDQESLEILKADHWAAIGKNRKLILVGDHDQLKFWLTIKNYLPNVFFKRLPKLACNSVNNKTVYLSPEEFLRQRAAIIQHEGGHIINRDSALWRDKKKPSEELHAYATITGILVAHVAFFCKNRLIAFSLASAIVGAFHQIRPKELLWYSRYQEARSDETIEDNIYVLCAFKDYLRDIYLSNPNFYDTSTESINFTHPHPKLRIKRLKERIKALKEKNDTKSFEDPLL